MSVVIVGGDKLGNIPNNLSQLGFNCKEHITGRKCHNCNLVQNIDVVLVLTDYVGHNLCDAVKNKAKSRGIKTIFCRRSWSDIYKKLKFCGLVA